MDRNRTAVAAWLAAGLLMVALPMVVVAAPEDKPAPTTGAAAAPRPPAMVDEKAAAKANPHPVTQSDQAPVNLGDPELEPQVTIIERDDEMHEEVRVNGVVRYIKVTPKIGPAYYLIPKGNGETYIRRDSLGDLRVPMWQIYSW